MIAGLFDASTHRALLDEFGDHEKLADEVAARYAAFDAARAALDALQPAQAAAAADADFVKQAVEELSALAPEEGEEIGARQRTCSC